MSVLALDVPRDVPPPPRAGSLETLPAPPARADPPPPTIASDAHAGPPQPAPRAHCRKKATHNLAIQLQPLAESAA